MRRLTPGGSHAISGIFIFLLVGLFAISAILLTVMGIQVYRGVADAGAQSVRSQTLVSYLCNKLHAYDRAGGVVVGEHGGLPTLALREQVEGDVYTTLIYAYEGTVREQLLGEGDAFDPEQGEPIAEARELRFERSDGLLTLFVDGQESLVQRVALRSAPEGGM